MGFAPPHPSRRETREVDAACKVDATRERHADWPHLGVERVRRAAAREVGGGVRRVKRAQLFARVMEASEDDDVSGRANVRGATTARAVAPSTRHHRRPMRGRADAARRDDGSSRRGTSSPTPTPGARRRVDRRRGERGGAERGRTRARSGGHGQRGGAERARRRASEAARERGDRTVFFIRRGSIFCWRVGGAGGSRRGEDVSRERRRGGERGGDGPGARAPRRDKTAAISPPRHEIAPSMGSTTDGTPWSRSHRSATAAASVDLPAAGPPAMAHHHCRGAPPSAPSARRHASAARAASAS